MGGQESMGSSLSDGANKKEPDRRPEFHRSERKYEGMERDGLTLRTTETEKGSLSKNDEAGEGRKRKSVELTRLSGPFSRALRRRSLPSGAKMNLFLEFVPFCLFTTGQNGITNTLNPD